MTAKNSKNLLSRIPEWQTATLLREEYISKTIKSFVFKLEKPYAYLPGQFCDIQLKSIDGSIVQRSYSIASPSNRSQFELGIQILENGRATSILDKMKVGEWLLMKGPLGRYFIWDWDKEKDDQVMASRPLLLVGGGSGVVPLLSMLRRHVELQNQGEQALPNIYALFSFKTFDDIPWKDELFSYMSGSVNQVKMIITLTREKKKSWQGKVGRIDSSMLAQLLSNGNQDLQLRSFLCGKTEFVDAVGESLRSLNITQDIKAERYG